MDIQTLNNFDEQTFRQTLEKCCGSSTWIKQMIRLKPYHSEEDVLAKSTIAWSATREEDWLEAFSHHPKIGDLKSLETKFASTKVLAGSEQAAVTTAPQSVLQELANANMEYENKFGFIFIVCATGKSAGEMLDLLQQRIHNDRNTELKIAANEQFKITQLRLQKILS